MLIKVLKDYDHEIIQVEDSTVCICDRDGKLQDQFTGYIMMNGMVHNARDSQQYDFIIWGDEKGWKPKKRKTHSKNNKTEYIAITPDHETDKVYAVCIGSNGCVDKGCKVYYTYIAKSICKVVNNIVYAPLWACKELTFNQKKAGV